MLIRTSTPPCSSITSCAIRSMSSRSDRSAGCTCAVPPRSSTCLATSSSFSRVRETRITSPPASPTCSAVSRPMPLEAPVISTRLSLIARGQRAVAEQVGVEVALPVVPQLAARRCRAAARRCRCPSSARWVSRASKVQRKSRISIAVRRDAEVAVDLVADPLDGRQRHDARRAPASGMALVRFWSTRMANCGAWAALANVFSVSPTVIGSGSTRWKVSPGRSSSGRWAMWSIALATKSTGTMLVWPPSGPASGNHCRQRVAQLLEQLEEVVGPVDLVHLAGLGVADDDPRAVDQRLGLDVLARTSFSDSYLVRW